MTCDVLVAGTHDGPRLELDGLELGALPSLSDQQQVTQGEGQAPQQPESPAQGVPGSQADKACQSGRSRAPQKSGRDRIRGRDNKGRQTKKNQSDYEDDDDEEDYQNEKRKRFASWHSKELKEYEQKSEDNLWN